MFWIAILAVPAAIALIKLGALSVWVYVLSAALTATTAVIAAMTIWQLVRGFRRT
jgi:hypothetical protein